MSGYAEQQELSKVVHCGLFTGFGKSKEADVIKEKSEKRRLLRG